MTISMPRALRGDATRDALIAAAIMVFGRDGFHAASTRALADEGGVNQALIGYHFGSKEGLYLAVFEHITERMGQRMGPIAAEVEALLAQKVAGSSSARRERYLPALLQVIDGLLVVLTTEESADWARLILREQQAPSAAFEVLYGGHMGRVLRLLTRLVQELRPGDRLADARLRVLAIVGQVLVFRVSRATVMRHMGWSRIGKAEITAIRDQLRRNVTALLLASE